MVKKPTGKRDFWEIRIGNEIASSFKHLRFPTAKEEIEHLIMNMFCRELDQGRSFELLSAPVKLTEHDIDFHIDTSVGEIGFELVEDAPLNKEGYDGLKLEYTAEERYEHIKRLIQIKSRKYKEYSKTKLKSLIIYNTDGKVALIDSIIALVMKYCHTNEMTFDYIFYLNPRPDLTCALHLFYPQSKGIVERVLSFDEDQLKKDGYIKIL